LRLLLLGLLLLHLFEVTLPLLLPKFVQQLELLLEEPGERHRCGVHDRRSRHRLGCATEREHRRKSTQSGLSGGANHSNQTKITQPSSKQQQDASICLSKTKCEVGSLLMDRSHLGSSGSLKPLQLQ
jgi:hypothetical protein